jgi:DNA-binding response OmpR family regulator
MGGRILVIDDEPMVREAVGRMLVAEGYAVDHASDGAAALAILDADPPDAILLDLMMPGMNGRQFLTVLREDRRSQVPVVVMTAVHGLAQRAVDLGATDVVEKPFDLDELINKIALAVFRSRRARFHSTTPLRHLPPAPPLQPDERVVVVIDDDLDALARIDDLLGRHGFTVVPVPRLSGDVRRTLRALRPRVIVVGSDHAGGPTAGELRAGTGLPDVPILAWRRGDALPNGAAGPADVTLNRPTDDDLVRTVALMSGVSLPLAEPPGGSRPHQARPTT